MKTVYHVRFLRPVDGKADYFFSSIAAIFTRFAEAQIGCNLTALWAVKVSQGFVYHNERIGCSIVKEPVIGKKHQNLKP